MMAASGAASEAGRTAVHLEWGVPLHGAAGLAAVLVAGLVAWGVVALYRRERASAAHRFRWLCAALRLACLGAVALVLLRPFTVREVTRPIPGRVVVLADRSASMSVRDPRLPEGAAVAWAEALGLEGAAAARAATRHDLVRALLERNDMELARRLSRRNRVELLTFAEDVRPVLRWGYAPEGQGAAPNAPPPGLPDWAPDGRTTDLAGALRAVLEDEGEARLAGVVVLTDGRDTEGGDLREVAAAAARRGVAVHFVGLGGPEAPADVRLAGVQTPGHALKGLPMRVVAFLDSTGFDGKVAEVVLSVAGQAGEPPQELLRRSVVLAGGERQEVDLSHVPEVAGVRRYVIRVAPLPGEARDDDNEVVRQVLVGDRKVRVLLVAGGPSIEFRFLRALLQRVPLFEVTTRTPGAGGGRPLPGTRAELLEYDVVVLCDPPLDALTPDWVQRLADAVDREGLGVAFLAGPTYTPELVADPGATALRELLPVVVDSARVRALVARTAPFESPRSVAPAPGAQGHGILAQDADAAGFWRAVPPVYWVLPAERLKAGATELLSCREPGGRAETPLVAVQPFGAGRVFYCGTPETWRWRREGIERYERFWLQALRYCAAGRLEGDGARARIMLERQAYAAGEAVLVRLRLPAGAEAPGDGQRVTLAVRSAGRRVAEVPLSGATGAEGTLEGAFHPPGSGHYELVYEAPDGTTATASLTVGRPDVEFEDLRADEAAMRDAAAMTGGRYFGPGELSRLPGAIPDAGREVVETAPPEPLWDAPYVLGALVGALAAEWLLRKRMGLL